MSTALAPSQEHVDEAFELIETADPSLHRVLITRLYTRPSAWHDVRNQAGETLLLACARMGLTMQINMLLDKGFDPEAWRNDLCNSLHLAPTVSTAMTLLQRTGLGLTVDCNADGQTPLHLHLQGGDPALATFLLKLKNATSQVLRFDHSGETPLFNASRNHPSLVWSMLLQGADPRVKNKCGQTAIAVCTDKTVANQMSKFVALLDSEDASRRTDAVQSHVTRTNAELAKRARAFLLEQGAAPVQPTPASP